MEHSLGLQAAMTTEAHNILLGVGVVVILLVASCALRAQDSDYLKQVLRLQHTEFCATVGKPPRALAEAINAAAAQDPKTWQPIVQWWNKISEKYESARCGDA